MGFLRSKNLKIVLVDDLEFRAQRIVEALNHDRRFADGVRAFRTLNEAYGAIEQTPPDLVMVSAKCAASDEFLMVEALLKMLRKPHLVIGNATMSEAEITARWRDEAHIEEFLHRLDVRLNGSHARPRGTQRMRGAGGAPVLIGSSTGGIEALETILRDYPPDCPPTFIVQHINPHFLGSLVDRLDRRAAPDVVEARDGMAVERGVVAVAPGGPCHLVFSSRTRMALVDGAPKSGHRPSVDRLFSSAAAFAPEVVAAILTGMGRDGAEGMADLKARGAWTIAQDQQSSVVYGMPQAAVQANGVCEELPVQSIGPAILKAAAARVRDET